MILLIDRHVPRHLFTWTFVPQTVTSWGSRSHVTPISSQYPPLVKRPNSRQAIVKSRRFVILLKKAAKKKNNIGDEERAVTFPFKEVFDRHWNLSDAGLHPNFKKNLRFSLDESHYNCKYHVRKISKVSVIQCKFNWVSVRSPSQPFSGEELCIKRHNDARLIRTQALKSNYDNFHNFLNGFFCMLITVSSQRGYLTTKSTQWIWTKQYSQINLTSYW